MAMLPIQRCTASGACVPCWKMFHAPPWRRRNSYQRTPACPCPVASTVWFSNSTSLSPKFRYCARNIGHTDRVSSLTFVLGCGTHGSPRLASQMEELKGMVGSVRACLKVDDEGWFQLTENSNISI